MQAKIFEVADGDTITIIAKVPVSATDPAHTIKAVARSYRVVANSWGPVLSLVALHNDPKRITDYPFKEGAVGFAVGEMAIDT